MIIDDMPIQFCPSYISPLFNDAIRKARRITIKRIPSKVVRVEHLTALLLVSLRTKDKIRILELMGLANNIRLRQNYRVHKGG